MTLARSPEGYRELVSRVAAVTAWPSEELEVAGDDRSRFLNGLVTCDLRQLAPGMGRYGFITTVKGRVMSDVIAVAFEDRFLLVLPPGSAEEVRDHIERYKVADRVTVSASTAPSRAFLAGPEAGATLREIVGAVPDVWGGSCGPGWWIVGDPRLGVPGWRVGTEEPEGAEVSRALDAADVVPAGVEATTAVRVERGFARFAIDFDHRSVPQETGLEKVAVSYDKGCYLGQEVVARIHYRGSPSGRLKGFVAPPNRRLARGDELLLDGERVGAVTSGAWSPELERFVGLGRLDRKAEGVESVGLGDGTEVEVVEPPIVKPSSSTARR
jgi:folate-binding protein YgfZ